MNCLSKKIPDPNTPISRLMYSILAKLAQYLNVGSNDMNWRGLIASIPDNIYSDLDIETFALANHRYNGSASLDVLRDLGNRGRTVRQLISYLEKMKHEDCLKLIKKPEKIHLLQLPMSQTVQAGPQSQAVFACNARGFPTPQYKWYHAYLRTDGDELQCEEVQGEADRILKISPVSVNDCGSYCCQVYRVYGNQIAEQVFTAWAMLIVHPPPEGVHSDDADFTQMKKPQIIQQPPVSLSVRPGKPIKVTCLATGCPLPTYQWYKYGYSSPSSPLEPHALRDQTKEELYWAQSTSGDKGTYCCRVKNRAGVTQSTTVKINVDAALADSYPDRIQIVRHPQSITCRIGEKQQILACQASVSEGKLYYQWYHNHQEIAGANESTLVISLVKAEDRGLYQCRINNDYACVTSKDAVLEIQGGMQPMTSNFYATDKVALLIGNRDYRSAERLSAPKGDVERLGVELSKLQFKVVSLLDLSLQETKFALRAFCDLLNSGVYAVFYFSGHGFMSDGQTYLVPVDAGTGFCTKECICDQEILDLMQNRNTALNVMLLDICRKVNEYPQPESSTRYQPDVKGNTVFGYAAQAGTQAFEVAGQESGIFTRYLIERIRQRKKITHVIEDVLTDVKNDPCGRGKQFPALSHTLNEARCLTDEIDPRGHTMEINARSLMWGEAHLLPPSPIWKDLQHGVVVCIQLETVFSNVMMIYTYINCQGKATDCSVKLEKFTPEIDITVEEFNITEDYPPKISKMISTTVCNLQKLRGDLESTVTVEGKYQGRLFQDSCPLVIPKPLVANLWQTKRYAEPSEASYPTPE